MRLSSKQYHYLCSRLVEPARKGRPSEFYEWWFTQDKDNMKKKLASLTGTQASHIISQLAQENYAEAIKRWEAISAI